MNENKYGRKVAILALALMVGYVLFFKVWDGGHKWTENIRDFRDYGYRVIDTQGQLASDECFYHSVKFNSNGVRLDRRGSKLYGFVDLQGSEVYEKASELIKDKSMAFRSEIEFYLDDDIFIATLEDDDELSVHIILLESGEEYIVENAYAEMVSVNYSEDLFVVQDRNTMKEGYVNKYGQWIIEPGFDSAYKFSDGLARVRENGLYGYIDHQGNYVIPPQFSSADEFSEGYAAVAYEEGFNICEHEDLYYNDEYIGTDMGLYVDEFSFDKDMSETYYCVSIVDMDNHTIDEDVSDPEDPYKLVRAALEAEGKNVFTREEIKEIEDEHRQEIGFTDDLYSYGDELYPGSDD